MRVTLQPKTWHDGTPVKDWPAAHYVGTVTEVFKCYGVPTARVKWDTGRKSLESLDRLLVVTP